MVHPELHLVALGRETTGRHHHAGVVDERSRRSECATKRAPKAETEARSARSSASNDSSLRVRCSNIEQRGLRTRLAAACKHDFRPAAGKRTRGFQANATVGSSDDGDASCQVRKILFRPTHVCAPRTRSTQADDSKGLIPPLFRRASMREHENSRGVIAMNETKGTCLVTGVGPGTGAAIVRHSQRPATASLRWHEMKPV